MSVSPGAHPLGQPGASAPGLLEHKMDALEFPRFMCRPGGSWMLETGPHEVRTVADAAEAEKALSEGWKFSQYDETPKAEKPADKPTDRATLEARAKELGLTYHHRTGDEKLARLIAEAESK